MFRPLNDQVVVEPIKAAKAVIGNLVLPDAAKANYHGLRAEVVAVGKGHITFSGERMPLDVKVGDIVLLRSPGPLINEDDRVFCIVAERDILAVVEGENGTPRKHFSPIEVGLN